MPWISKAPSQWIELLKIQAKPRTGLHCTDLLGCPRKRAGLAEGWTVDLDRLASRLAGTIMHGKLAEIDRETAEVPVSGVLFGLDIVGSVDRVEAMVDEEGVLTVDYKTSEGGGALPPKPYGEHVWQQEAYRYVMAQRRPKPWITSGWRIYYRKSGKWSCYEHIGPLWTEGRLAEFVPHGGAFTTRELADQCSSGAPAASLPLVGATQKIGRGSACEYCELQTPCNEKGYQVEL